MITEKIDLYKWAGVERKGEEKGYLYSFRHMVVTEMNVRKTRPAILIFPGGGYCFVSQREGEPIALQYLAQGFDCFVLDYDIAPAHRYPVPLVQAGMAMIYLRREAENLHIDAEHIAAVGFSAGGHLCGIISLLWDDPALKEMFKDECVRIRPDASVYSYAVVTSGEKAHRGSFESLCADKVKQEDYSLENKVRSSAAPSFIWATTTDDAVPVENSLMLYAALHKVSVPVELHIFEKGPHGMSTCDIEVCNGEPTDPAYKHAAHWLPLSFEFLKNNGFTIKIK